MIYTVLEVIEWLCLLAGSFFLVTGGIGVLRFPDLFTRFHAASITDTMGAGLILAGLMLETVVRQHGFTPLIKLLMIVVFLMITSPSAAHALAKAAIHGGIRPRLSGPRQDPGPEEKHER